MLFIFQLGDRYQDVDNNGNFNSMEISLSPLTCDGFCSQTSHLNLYKVSNIPRADFLWSLRILCLNQSP